MSVMTSLPCKTIHGLSFLPRQGAIRHIQNPSLPLYISRLKKGCRCYSNHGTECWIMGREVCSTVMHAVMGDVPGATPPPTPNFPIWASWILGSIFSLILPIWKLKGGFLQRIGNKVESVADAVEDVAEIVEDVAEVVEKISSEVVDSLPGDGALKNAASWVEQASKEVAEDAGQAVDFIRKVDEFKEEVEKEWETLAESHADEEMAERESRNQNEGEETEEANEKSRRKESEDRETTAAKESEEEEKQGREEKEAKETNKVGGKKGGEGKSSN